MKNQELWEAVRLEDYEHVKQLLEEINLQVINSNSIGNILSNENEDIFG